MKPEHEAWVGRIGDIVDAATTAARAPQAAAAS
jgi:hypothetical protein